MNNYSNTFRIGNEPLLLINILNTMYNDNLRQITNINETLNNLNDANNQILNLLVQLLYNPDTNQINNFRQNVFSERRDRNNNVRNNNVRNNNERNNNVRNNNVRNNNERNNNDRNNNSNRIFVNNRPYVIDFITEYNIPPTSIRNNINRNIDISELSNIFDSFMHPVEVYPTQSQIESATRRVCYCDISRPLYNQCPISLDEFNDNDMVTVIRHCGHIFHTEHLMNWFRTNSRCPVCRFDIREFNSNASTEFFNNNSQNNSQSQSHRTETLDVSNNNIERNGDNRIDNTSSVTTNLFNNILDDTFTDIVLGTTDLSGNRLDNVLSGTTALLNLFNAMNNRPRNSR